MTAMERLYGSRSAIRRNGLLTFGLAVFVIAFGVLLELRSSGAGLPLFIVGGLALGFVVLVALFKRDVFKQDE
jgi:hypothetical protein